MLSLKQKLYLPLMLMIALPFIYAETLFEVKDSSNNKVLDVSTDGLRIMNQGDTLMVISTGEIKANLITARGLSRSFSVTTNSSKGSGIDLMRLTSDSTRFWISDTGSGFGVSSQTALKEKSVATNFLKVSKENTEMREGNAGGRYTDFSPDNIFVGLNSGISTTPGIPNEFSGKLNVFLGNESGRSNTSGGSNIMIGNQSGLNNTTGHSNMFLGNNSGETNTTGEWNLFIGHGSGKKNTSGGNNLFIGHTAGQSNTTGYANLFIGTDAAAYNTTGQQNVYVGQGVGVYNMTGSYNTFIGRFAGNAAISSENTFLGYSAGSSHDSGAKNTFVGMNSGKYNNTGEYNTFVGFGAGENSDYTSSSTYIGYYSGYNATGYGNTFMGWGSGRDCYGAYNVVLGHGAGNIMTSGGSNVFIGSSSGYNNTAGSGNVFLGSSAGYNETGSDKLYIDNSSTSTPLLHGDFSTDFLTVNGTLKVRALEISDMGSSNLGLDGDVVPYSGSTSGYDLGNNVAGEYWDDVVALEYITFSDRNTKDEVKSISHGLSDIMKLRPVSYRYKKEVSADDKIKLGLIAQEVEEVIPEAVVNDDVDVDAETGEKIITKGQYKGMNYDQLIPVLIKAVQEQQAIIEDLKREIDQIKTK